MATESLENITNDLTGVKQINTDSSIEVYATGLSRLYTGPIGGPIFGNPPMMNFGNMAPLNGPLFKTPDIEPTKPLCIIDLPACGVQIHIHEGPGGTTHFKTYDGKYINMNGYNAAIADLFAKNIDLKKID